jgi:hypothetical protein
MISPRLRPSLRLVRRRRGSGVVAEAADGDHVKGAGNTAVASRRPCPSSTAAWCTSVRASTPPTTLRAPLTRSLRIGAAGRDGRTQQRRGTCSEQLAANRFFSSHGRSDRPPKGRSRARGRIDTSHPGTTDVSLKAGQIPPSTPNGILTVRKCSGSCAPRKAVRDVAHG